MRIYHNPKCSKSREALALLIEQGVKLDVVEYLRTPLTHEEILSLLKFIPPQELVRTKDDKYKELNFELNPQNVVKFLVEFPELMERPIVVARGKVIVARPPERVRELF